MVGGFGPVALLLASYLYFVLSLGPRLMQHRKPFKLDKLLIVYNAVQVACSLHVVKEVRVASGVLKICVKNISFSLPRELLRKSSEKCAEYL